MFRWEWHLCVNVRIHLGLWSRPSLGLSSRAFIIVRIHLRLSEISLDDDASDSAQAEESRA